ncbi:hypothetical protein [Kribbella speibonae]|uniref:DUF946 domain-containing protein n=1 Tax=Kribbella speibonae TaxID=1572660 RepID=A0A4R0J825_9ACTN|nr:hypothetical protein [Kribbella speibonae]TCC16651.1 hypothetical protein E0H58_39990 [Kribbella speibonae]TCC41830.1 hypothetical protein E0H92_09370 [Kribbella speibonae]
MGARPLVFALTVLLFVVLHEPVAAADSPEDTAAHVLADRYAPIVRLQDGGTNCEYGEQFQPTDVEAVLGDQQVALRGPWRPPDLVKTQPEGTDLGRAYPGHFLDFPGDPLRPGCDYAEWSARINRAHPATVYAHVVADSGLLSLEYWFFYVFNDYNNTHEGDWESVQLIFDATTPTAALRTDPTAVGFSQHGGAERARWGDAKLEIVDGTHPVVYPAAGSHANKFGRRLYLGRGSEGLGCDDTTRPGIELRPKVAYVPMARADYLKQYPWLAFEGRWGERQRSFFDGPTGPNQKASWVQPVQDAEATWRDDSTTVPAGRLLGPSSTGAFCTAVATGSNLLRETLDRTWLLGLLLTVVVILIWLAASRTRWSPSTPLPARTRRAWGQAVAAAFQLFRQRPGLFGGFALAFVVLSLATLGLAELQAARHDAPADLGAPTENATGFWASLLALAVTALTAATYVVLLAAVTSTLDRLDRSVPVTTAFTWHDVRSRARPLAAVALRYFVVIAVLTVVVATIPLAVYYAVSRAFALPAVIAEQVSASTALKRSRLLVKGRWWRTAGRLTIVVGLGLAVGPIAGIVLLLATDLQPTLINVVSSLLFALVMPLVAAAVGYLYFDRAAAVREQPEEVAQIG